MFFTWSSKGWLMLNKCQTIIIIKALSQLYLGRLYEFHFSILIYSELNFQISWTSSNLHSRPYRPTPLLIGFSTCMPRLFLIGVIVSLRWTCPYHLKWVFLISSPIDSIPKCLRNRSFLILSFLFLLCIHLNVNIYATSILCICCLLIW